MNFLPLPELRAGAVILVDKPYRWTSFDAVARLRNNLHVKIGHAGTLDPLATGLLILCTGSFTKKIETFQKQPKEYTGVFHLGATTPTFDLESEPENFQEISGISEEQIRAATAQFTGDILQDPPIHSAIKKDGRRAYDYARKGEEVKLAPRAVHVSAFELTEIGGLLVRFRIACSTGTYIRSIAQDFGKALGCGAYLQELRRTRIGDFHVDDAADMDAWTAYLKEVTNNGERPVV